MTSVADEYMIRLPQPLLLGRHVACVGWNSFYGEPMIDLGGTLWTLSQAMRPSYEEGLPGRFSDEQINQINAACADIKREYGTPKPTP